MEITKVLALMGLRGWRQRVVTRFGNYYQVRIMHMHVDVVVSARKRSLGVVAEGVLVAGDLSDLGVGALDGLLIELGKGVSARIDGIFGQNVTVAKARQPYAVQPIVNRNGSGIHAEGVNRDVLGKQEFTYFIVASSAAVFTTIADNKNDAPPDAFFTPAQVLGCAEDGIVQNI